MTAPPESLRLRLARAADVPVLDALIAASVRALSRGYYSPRQIESALRFVFGVDTQLLADGTYYLIEASGEPVACGGWSRRATLYGGDQHKTDTDDPLLDPATAPARIRAFFVHPAWARRGLGRRLLHACSEAAARDGFSALELMATLPGEPLYAALGFAAVEPIEVVLPDGVPLPLVRMRRAAAHTSAPDMGTVSAAG
jgi:GNAT superfamily N-acetyltransferase